MPRGIYNHTNNHTTRTHGLSNTKFNVVYRNLRNRCNKVNDREYKNYGGRGIHCEWNTFYDFIEDMYESFNEHNKEHGGRNTQIDRIDVNGNYCKENCRRVTSKEQSNNRRNIKRYNYKGEYKTITELSEKIGLKPGTIRWRLNRGLSIEEVIRPILYYKF